MDRRIKKTHTAIFEAYIQSKTTHPGVEPSVKEICAIADVNKTTFYRYYTDTDSLSDAVTKAAATKLLIEGIDIKVLLTDPEIYFRQVLNNLRKDEYNLNALIKDNPHKFIFEAEKLLKTKLKETAPDKYDEVLYTFIAGGASHYFLSADYNDENELQKFCSIIKAATASLN